MEIIGLLIKQILAMPVMVACYQLLSKV